LPRIAGGTPLLVASNVRYNLRNCVGEFIISDFVFPHADHCPSLFFEERGLASVPINSGLNLFLPPVSIRLGQGEVLFAAMPKATINEHTHLLSGKDNVGCTAKARLRSALLPESDASRVEGSAQTSLGITAPRQVG
jgi:hypothetical protein